MTSDEYWFGDPNMIFAYKKAYDNKEKQKIQGLWLQGKYFASAITSTVCFKGNPPPYPEMPFKDEVEEEMAKDEKWLQAERQRTFNHFYAILNKKH